MCDNRRPKERKGVAAASQPLRLSPQAPIKSLPIPRNFQSWTIPQLSKTRRQTELGMNQGIAPLPPLLAPKKNKYVPSSDSARRKKGMQAKE